MDRYMLFPSGMGQHPNGSYALYADAQSTIAALQARVKELEEWKHIVTGAGTDQESVIRLAAYEYTKIAVQCWKEANAKLESQLTQRTAELEALRKWRDNVTAALQRPGGAFFEDVPKHIKDLVTAHTTLRGLVDSHNTYILSCPWCWKQMESNATLTMSHLIQCGDARYAALQKVTLPRESGARLRRALEQAGDEICSEFCGAGPCHKKCMAVKNALDGWKGVQGGK